MNRFQQREENNKMLPDLFIGIACIIFMIKFFILNKYDLAVLFMIAGYLIDIKYEIIKLNK